jgi:hypothetical protein
MGSLGIFEPSLMLFGAKNMKRALEDGGKCKRQGSKRKGKGRRGKKKRKLKIKR